MLATELIRNLESATGGERLMALRRIHNHLAGGSADSKEDAASAGQDTLPNEHERRYAEDYANGIYVTNVHVLRSPNRNRIMVLLHIVLSLNPLDNWYKAKAADPQNYRPGKVVELTVDVLIGRFAVTAFKDMCQGPDSVKFIDSLCTLAEDLGWQGAAKAIRDKAQGIREQ